MGGHPPRPPAHGLRPRDPCHFHPVVVAAATIMNENRPPRYGYRRANVRAALRDGGAGLKTCSYVNFHVKEASTGYLR